MRYMLISIMLIFFFSCEKEKDKSGIFYAYIDADSISFMGNAQRYTDVKNKIIFGFNYHIFNLETPSLYIEAYDSSLIEKDFIFPKVSAKYSFIDSTGKSSNYNSINGGLRITNEQNGVLFGTFNFKLTNINNETDTLEIDKGYFEITLDENDRIW